MGYIHRILYAATIYATAKYGSQAIRSFLMYRTQPIECGVRVFRGENPASDGTVPDEVYSISEYIDKSNDLASCHCQIYARDPCGIAAERTLLVYPNTSLHSTLLEAEHLCKGVRYNVGIVRGAIMGAMGE